jgi:hypothetical protein
LAETSESGTGPLVGVKQTPGYRAALAAVIILGVLIVVALGALIFGFVLRAGSHKPAAIAADAFAPPAGSKLVSTEVSNDRLILHLRDGTTDEIDIVDTTNGHLVARLRFAAP